MSNKGSYRLFKGVSLCPPIDPKTILSPPLDAQKSFRTNENSSSTGSRKKGRTNSTNSAKGQKLPAQ